MSILPEKSIDRRLIKAASSRDKTPQDLSEATLGHLTPTAAVERLHWLLENVTILDEVEERRLMLIDMAEHLSWLKDNRDNPKMVASIPRMYKLLSDQIDKTNINLDEVTNRINDTQARLLVAAVDAIVSRVVAGLMKRGIEAEESVIWAEVEEAMPIAIGQVDAAREPEE